MSCPTVKAVARALAAVAVGLLLGVGGGRGVAQPAPAGNPTNFVSQLVEAAGKIEVAPAGSDQWQAVRAGQWLRPGDRLRTLANSRAALRLSDRSVVRLNASTIVEIQPPVQGGARRRFKLWGGSLFFFNREKPADIEFETPLATGAIRGTEFVLEVNPAQQTTFLGLLDGAVELRTPTQSLALQAGQQALLAPGKPAVVSAVLPLTTLIQWCFYYPGIVNPSDLRFTAPEERSLADSLRAYRAGDLLAARARAPELAGPGSNATRAYLAALELAVGQVHAAEALLAPLPADDGPALALREVIAAVRYQAWQAPRPPASSSEWLAHSYYLQSRGQLPEALGAARRAVALAPDFGFAWVRVAELAFGFEDGRATREALAKGRQLSPRDAQALALAGFLELEANHPRAAKGWFDAAIQEDGALANAWLGRALCEEALRAPEAGRRDLETAAALEPQRALLRSYLGKAWSQAGNDALAAKDFALAEHLDPSDPTAWLYSALHRHQVNQVNDAVRDLERSIDLNDNRRVFRSRLGLDRDRAIRGADLAAVYDTAGLTEVSQLSASRAITEDYSDFSGHLFLSLSLQAQEDPAHVDLRLETPRESELLLANLLAPPGGGNLSQVLSQQDHLQYFDTRPFGISSLTQYDSQGDWSEAGSVFGCLDGLSYAVDSAYLSQHGQRPNEDLDSRSFSFQAKQQLTPQDSVYVQTTDLRSTGGDVAEYYNPAAADMGLRVTEVQEPNVYLGYHREWSPSSHTLFLAGRLSDVLTLQDPRPNVLFLRQTAGVPTSIQTDPFFSLASQSAFTLYSVEGQQLWETPKQGFIIGARYQSGSVATAATLSRGPTGVVSAQDVAPNFQRLNGYAYYQWHPWEPLQFMGGLSYEDLSFPANVDLPPVVASQDHRSLFGPKVGLTLEPWHGGLLRAAYTRSLGGLYFDNSVRLEPTQIAGFTDAFRSLLPESAAGLAPGTRFQTYSVGFDQSLRSSTYFGVSAELLRSLGDRTVGVFTNATALPIPDAASSLGQNLDFRERTLTAYVDQLLGRRWSTGARYSLSEAVFHGAFPGLSLAVPGATALTQNEHSVLGHLQLYLLFNHESGFFAEWSSDWYRQSNRGYTPDEPGDSFWQQNFFVGYRWDHRRAELRLGVVNLTDQNYQLSPLNYLPELPFGRTFTASLRLNF